MKSLLHTLALIICLLVFTNDSFGQVIVSASPRRGQPVCSSISPERPDVPDLLTCDGESYCFKDQSYYGVCGRVFCQAHLCANSKSCKDDNEPKTVACYNKMVAASNAKATFSQGAEIPSKSAK